MNWGQLRSGVALGMIGAITAGQSVALPQRSRDSLPWTKLGLAITCPASVRRVAQQAPDRRSFPARGLCPGGSLTLVQHAGNRVDAETLLCVPHRSSVPPCNARYRGRGLTRPRRRKRPEVGLTQVLEQNVAGLGCSLPNTHPERHLPERAGRSPGRVLKHGSVRRTYLSVLILAGNSTYAILLTTTD